MSSRKYSWTAGISITLLRPAGPIGGGGLRRHRSLVPQAETTGVVAGSAARPPRAVGPELVVGAGDEKEVAGFMPGVFDGGIARNLTDAGRG